MGKSLPSASNLQTLANILSSNKPKQRKRAVPFIAFKKSEVRVDSERVKVVKKMEEDSSISLNGQKRLPLARVVTDCVKRWFQDTLKEAKAGDIAMQILVGQMYYSGYGVPQDGQKSVFITKGGFGRYVLVVAAIKRIAACAWINKASKTRVSAWKVKDKRPGYNASDLDSDEVMGDTK